MLSNMLHLCLVVFDHGNNWLPHNRCLKSLSHNAALGELAAWPTVDYLVPVMYVVEYTDC